MSRLRIRTPPTFLRSHSQARRIRGRKVFYAITSVVAALFFSSAASAQTRRPNVVLITIDTTRADALGVYGQPQPTTPAIDRIASRGVVFEHAITTNPETLPSHASLFTGMFPFSHGVRENLGQQLAEENVTLAEILSGHGYRTGAEIASEVLRDATRITQGFEHTRDPNSPGMMQKRTRIENGEDVMQAIREGANITDKGIEFIRRNRSQPFFLWLHYFDPHHPRAAPPAFRQRIPDSPYHAEVASADASIGRFLAELEALKMARHTLIVLTSDHGEGLDEHHEKTHSLFVYETTLHIPLVIAGLDGLPRGRRIPSVVRIIDVAPTILDYLGLPPLKQVQGVSLRPLIEGSSDDLGLTAYSEASRVVAVLGLSPLRALREGRWKYIHKVGPELYDLEADPTEMNNLFAQEVDVAARLYAKLETLLRDAPAMRTATELDLDAQMRTQLEALGYLGASDSVELDEQLGSLEVTGADPNTHARDFDALATAKGYINQKMWAEADALVADVYRRTPSSLYALDLLATAWRGLGRYQEVVKLLTPPVHEGRASERLVVLLAETLRDLGRETEAVVILLPLLERDRCNEAALSTINDSLYTLRRYAERIQVLSASIPECPELPSNANNLAWALATTPDPKLRDGKRAEQLVRAAMAGLDERDPMYLDTLAAAQAEQGQFDTAVATQTEVVELLGAMNLPAATLKLFSARLKGYRQHRPARDP
jgi:arylsulfatase A-like enzyme